MTMTFTRGWQYDDYVGGIEDSTILVDGALIGGAYLCADKTWASYGPCGFSFGHPTREAAEEVQWREYVTDPDLCDRLNAQYRAEQETLRQAHEAAEGARIAELDAEDRRQRLGVDEPGPTIWTLPAYHALYAPMDEVDAVCEWFAANGVLGVDAIREVRVEQRATRRVVVYEGLPAGAGRGVPTATWVVPLVTEPPTVVTPPRPDLHDLLDEHWPGRFPLIDFGAQLACGTCTRRASATTADELVPWPCPEITTRLTP